MKKYFIFSLMLIMSVSTLFAAGKVRVAVMEFENNAASYWRTQGLGAAAQDAMITALVETGQFTVIERQKIDMIIAEHKFGQSGAVTPQSAAKLGKLLGVQVVITGSVTQFGKSETGGGLRLIGGKAVEWSCALDARLINVNTGEIISVAKGEGSVTGGAARVKGLHVGTGGSVGERAGEVMREAVEEIVEIFQEKTSNLAASLGSSAKVALVKDGKVYVSAGTNYGVEVGDVFEVVRQGEAIIDPDTGIELDREQKVVGELEVVTARDKVSICKINSGEAAKGDVVKKK